MPKFTKSDESLNVKWDKINEFMSVGATFYHLDTEERKKNFINSLCKTEKEKETYAWYRSEWYRRPKEFDPGPQPLSLICELVSTCNLACNMCYTITEKFQSSVIGAQRMLPWSDVVAIIDEAAKMNIPSILFSWRGESTLYRVKHNGKIYTFADALKYARDKGILEVTSLTHGQLITPKMADEIIAADPSWISFSIDGMGKDYNLIRTPKNKKEDNSYNAFGEVVKSIKNLVDAKKNNPHSRTMIRTNTIYPAIHKYVQDYYEFMKNSGVDLVTVNELMEWSRYDGEDLPIEAIDLDWGCQYPFQRLVISASGVVLPCNGAVHQEEGLVLGKIKKPLNSNEDENTKGLGSNIQKNSINSMSLKEAWNCNKMNNIRNLHKNKKRIEINPGCRNCNHGIKKKGVSWIPEDWDERTLSWE